MTQQELIAELDEANARTRIVVRSVLDKSLELAPLGFRAGADEVGQAYADLARAANRWLAVTEGMPQPYRLPASPSPPALPLDAGERAAELEQARDPARVDQERAESARRGALAGHLAIETQCKCGKWIRGHAIHQHVQAKARKERGKHAVTDKTRRWRPAA